MKPHQLRVVIEQAELNLKLTALSDFIDNSGIFQGLDQDEKDRLKGQREVMSMYDGILCARLKAFREYTSHST